MKLSISQSELQHALNVVSKGAAVRSTLPILAGILLRAENESLIMESTDLNLSIRSKTPALIEEEGQVVVPATLFLNIIKKLSDAAVHIDVSEDTATILCDSTSVSLKTLVAQDFPAFPEVQPEQTTTIPFQTFSRMVKHVEKVVANDEMRPVLTGVLLEVENDKLRLVATDSYRLAITETVFETVGDDFSAVIPGPFMREIASLNQRDENLSFGFTENQILVAYNDYTFINRKIEGSYPNYNQLLPDSYETKITFDVQQIINAVDRTSLLSNKTTPVKFDVNNDSQTVQISTSTQDVGAASETIGATIEGVDTEIAFNHSYVLDGLRAAESDKITLQLQNSQRPGVFTTDTEDTYLYLIMPVRIV